VDIDPDRQPSKVADLNLGIPYADGEFQTCLAMGVFNYFYDFDTVTAEVVRILRPGGSFYAAIPFLDRVTSDHGDSVRLTAHALDKMLRGAGLKPDYILPCGSGGWGTALDMVEFMLPTPPLRSLAFRAAIALDGFATRRSGGKYRNAKDYPLGYLLLAHKA
jgi:SAM-dependent methyltransferase